jgi:protein FAM50
MYQFLQRCLELLRKEFSELKTVTADQLMYVKEDLILPHHYTFYDFIVTKVNVIKAYNFQANLIK